VTDAGIIATSSEVPVRARWLWRIAIAVVLTALADWLFFRRVVGISLAAFLVAIAAGVLATNRIEAGRRATLIYSGALVAALLPLLEDVNVLSVSIAALGIGGFALGVTAALRGNATDGLFAIGWFLISGPFQLPRDLPLFQQWARQRGAPFDPVALKGWIVPLALGGVFVALFAAANPLIANWFAQWIIGDSLKQLDFQRLMFWFGAIIVAWMFVCVGRRFSVPDRDELATAIAANLPAVRSSHALFNDTTIVRSLVLFNILFAVQTVMDVHYLWRGAALPDGMTYASYAHRGAYPLIVTALLAAAFVLLAMRPGSAAERSPLLRALVFLWVGQNVLLVLSAMLRLNLYVETYLLTYWRVAAFIWMLIVAAGLVLIVVRIVTYRSNAWLVSANLAVLALTIYSCSFVNFAAVVADYNVAQDRDGTDLPIDVNYLLALGPQAIPAVDRYLSHHPLPPRSHVPFRRDELAANHMRKVADWRAWTFRGWRLTRYLDNAKQP
jgi:hypothetical protein